MLHAFDTIALIVDVVLGDGSGFDVIARARKIHAGIPVLVLTVFGRHDFVSRAFDLGAEFLLKPCEASQLVSFAERARAAHRGTSGQQWPHQISHRGQ